MVSTRCWINWTRSTGGICARELAPTAREATPSKSSSQKAQGIARDHQGEKVRIKTLMEMTHIYALIAADICGGDKTS